MKIKYPYQYDQKKRKISKIYSRENLIKSIINSIFIPIIVLFVILQSGFGKYLQSYILSISGELFFSSGLYALILLTILTICEFPLMFYSSYIYEKKYGLSNYTLLTWFIDYFKATAIDYIFFVLTVIGLFYLLQISNWWLYAGIIYFFISVVLSSIMPLIVLPLFYKLEPYKDKAQKKKILDIIKRAGVDKIKSIFIVNESSKSVKANAMFTGIGSSKRIVLFDTLVNNFTTKETETVIAHELGHYINKDIWRFIAIDAIKIFPVLFVIDIILKNSVGSFGIYNIASLAVLPLIVLSYNIISLILMPLENFYSRSRETKADLFALNMVKSPEAQISTEKRLCDMALNEDDPNQIEVLLFHSHPSAKKRIEMCEKWKKNIK